MSSRFKPLSPIEARRSLSARISKKADRIRQKVADFGMRPYRVWLVWTRYDGAERGEGNEFILARVEILPNPRVSDMTALTMRTSLAGTYPDGSVRVDQVSAAVFSEDELSGLKIPMRGGNGQPAPPPAGCEGKDFDEQYSGRVNFAYWIQEDGRGDDPARIKRFRLMSNPFRDTSGFNWVMLLQRSDRDPERDGHPVNIGQGHAEHRRLMSR